MSNIALTSEIEASVKDQLSKSFLAACSGSGDRKTLAELVYNTAIKNSSIKKAEGDLDQKLTIFEQVLAKLGTEVRLDGSWFPFGGSKAENLGAFVSMGGDTQSYVGTTTIKIGTGHDPVGVNAIWISIN